MKYKHRKAFLFASLAFLLSSVIALAIIEGACTLLNRYGFRYETSKVPQVKTPNRKYAIEFSPRRLKRVENPIFVSLNHDILDYTDKEPANYFYIDNYSVLTPRPDQKARSLVKYRDGRTIYDVTHTIDSESRRVTPQKNIQNRKKHLLVMGCSFVFGEGVEDYQTLPARLAEVAPEYHVYNLGSSGYSPVSLWLRSKHGSLMENIPEKEGVGIYVFFDDHLRRVFGSMSVVSTWGAGLPYVEIDSNGSFTPLGSFANARPLLTNFFQWYWKTETRKFFNLDYPNILSREKLRKFGFAVEKLKEVYFEKFGSKEFYVTFYPAQSNLAYAVIPELERLGIHYLDYSSLVLQHYVREGAYIPEDYHPTAASHDFVANLINDDLLKRFSK